MKRRASMSVIFMTVFVDLIGFGIVLPLLPFFATHFGVAGFGVGSLSAVYSLTQFIFGPFWGRLSDKIGRRPVLLWGLAGSTLSYVALGFCDSYWQIFATRALAGFFGGNVGVASAYIADITPAEKRSQGMGLIGAAFGLGFVLGPAIGAGIAHLAEDALHPQRVYQAIGWVAASICAVNFLVGLLRLPESLPPERRVTTVDARSRFSAWRTLGWKSSVTLLIGLSFLLTLAFSIFEVLFALLLKGQFHFELKEANFFFLFTGLVSALVQGGLLGWFVRKFQERRLILYGGLVFSIALIAMPWTQHVWQLLLAVGGMAFGFGLNRSSVVGLISQKTGEKEQGEVLSLSQSMSSLARVFGPLLGGFLLDRTGGMVIPFAVAGALMLLGIALNGRTLCGDGEFGSHKE